MSVCLCVCVCPPSWNCRMFQNVPECMQNVPEWSKMFKNVCRSMSLHAGPWACMQLHKLVCSYISLHAGPWASMHFPELTWSSISFHELACSSILCLSSSQEFQSAWFCSPPACLNVKSIWEYFLPNSNLRPVLGSQRSYLDPQNTLNMLTTALLLI